MFSSRQSTEPVRGQTVENRSFSGTRTGGRWRSKRIAHTVAYVHGPLTLSFAQPFIDVPRAVAIELLQKMDEIIATLNAIPRGSTAWQSLVESWLVLRIGDWRFQYRIEPERDKVVVLVAARVTSAA